MKRLASFLVLVAASGGASAAAVTPGDLLVYRVGTGSAALSSAATAVFVDEYTPGGQLVQSIAMPTSASGANKALTASGSATSEGLITLSADGRYAVVTGYNTAPGTAGVAGTASATVARTIGVIDLSTGTVDTSTALSNFSSANNIRSAVTTNGTDLWVSGATTGVGYTTLGSTTATQQSTTVTNIRQLELANGQLYASTGSGTAVRVGTVGAGLPTTAGQVITNLPGFPTSGSPYSFYFADLSATVAGLDTLYVADDSAAGGGILKYTLNGGAWAASGSVAGGTSYRGLAGSIVNGAVNLFATRNAGELVSLQDASGYGGLLGGSAALLSTVGTNQAFRGVILTPIPEPSEVAMMLAGLLGVGALLRRRRAGDGAARGIAHA